MRLISLLLAILIIGLIVHQQLGYKASQEIETLDSRQELPKIPTSPKDIDKFGGQMNDFVNNAAAERARKIEAAESN